MVCPAVLVSDATSPAQETPSHKYTHRFLLVVLPSPDRPCSSGVPTRNRRSLRRLAKRNDVRCSLIESMADDLDLMLHTGEHRLLMQNFARTELKYKCRATLRAGILRQQQNTRLTFFSSRPIAKPRCQRNARTELRRNSSHVQHDDAEASSLQNQVRNPQSLIDARPGFSGAHRPVAHSKRWAAILARQEALLPPLGEVARRISAL